MKDKYAEKELAEQNCKILDMLQYSLSKNNNSLLNANCWSVTQSTICDKDDYSWKYYTEILKILIADTVATPKVKKFWSPISDFFHRDSPYSTSSKLIALLFELQQKDPMAQIIQKKLAIPNINVTQVGRVSFDQKSMEFFTMMVNHTFQRVFELICETRIMMIR